MDRFKLTKQDRINQYKIIMYNVIWNATPAPILCGGLIKWGS